MIINMLVLIIVNFFFSSCCSTGLHTNINNSSNLFILSKFLELQSEFCGYLQLCTIDRRIFNLTFSFFKQPCCRPCSCDDTCEHAGTCCPDVWLSDVRNNSIATSTTPTNPTEPTNQRNDSSLQMEDDDVSSCVSPRLQSRNRVYGYQGAEEGFLMISFCPCSYKNTEIKGNCEGAIQLKTTSKNTLIPVTSTKTGKTYRNLFCLECHEGNNKEFIHWENWLTCSLKNVLQNIIKHPDNLFSSVVLRQITYCNIVFKPPSIVNITTSTCHQADVTSCPETTRNTTTTLYEQMCRQFYLPVFETEEYSFTVYKNIACYLCNKGKSVPEYCPSLYPQYDEFNLQINIKHLTSNETNEHSLSYLDIRFDSICGEGYVFDEVLKYCRRVLCPRHFYVYNGTCEPMITIVQGVHYKMMLEITPDILITSQFYREYENSVDSVLTQEVTRIFSEIHIDIWRITENQVLISNVACLKFRNENKTYADTIQQLHTLLDKIGFLRNNSLKLSAKVKLAVNIVEQRQINRIPIFVDRETGREAFPVRVSRDTYLAGAEFEISKSHLCYRLELNVLERTFIGKNAYKIIRTGARIEGANFDQTQNREVACITDVMSITIDSTERPSVENINAALQKNPLVLVVIFGSLIALVVLTASVRLIINCRHRDDSVQ